MKKSVKRKIKKHKSTLILLITLTIFMLFLISIPAIFNESSKVDSILDEKEYIPDNTVNDPYEQSKLDHITNKIIEEITTTRIDNTNLIYINNLIANNEITNRENSIAQEAIAQHINKNYEVSAKIVTQFIETQLDKFDDPQSQKWRNHRLIINLNDEKLTLFDYGQLLIEPEESNIISRSYAKISPYEFQIYHLTFEDGTYKNITLNLITGEGENKLEEYINFETNQPKQAFEEISSEFVESNKSYEIEFVIWK